MPESLSCAVDWWRVSKVQRWEVRLWEEEEEGGEALQKNATLAAHNAPCFLA